MIQVITIPEEDMGNLIGGKVLIKSQDIFVVFAIAYASEPESFLDIGVVYANT